MSMRDQIKTTKTIKTEDRRVSRRALESALLEISERERLAAINAADYQDGTLAAIEGVAHELAHVLDSGPDFEISLEDMEDAQANDREAATLRIEVAALAELGVHLSIRRLWANANWRGDVRIPFEKLTGPLDGHELACVDGFVAMVRREIADAT